jgi:hypothetical protein
MSSVGPTRTSGKGPYRAGIRGYSGHLMSASPTPRVGARVLIGVISIKGFRPPRSARGDVDKFGAIEHLASLFAIEIAFPGGNDDGCDAVADQIAERARHANEPVDR